MSTRETQSTVALNGKRRLLIFRPQACSDKALLERMLYEREQLVDLLMDRVRDSALTGTLHQQLIHGPRGSGKTHVLTVVFNRLAADEELAGRIFVARLAEEQWEIASFADLCIAVLKALAERHPDSMPTGWETRLQTAPMPARSADMDRTDIERAALKLIQETVGDKLLLVIAENLDDLFKAIGEAGQRKLRAHIQQSRYWTLLVSSQSLFAALTSRSEPFFRFFQTHELRPLDRAATHGFLRRLAGDPAVGDPELRRLLAAEQGEQRTRAIDKLCGGNHRLLTMLYPFLAGDGLVDLVEPFLHMVDRELTPYYQERLRWLSSPQQRKITAYLAREGRPRTMKEVAQACFITEQSASKQLRELERVGFVLLTREGRQTFCEIREPLLRLVLDLQDHRDGAARSIVRVLRAWYSPSQLAELAQSEAVRGSRLYHGSVQAALTETRAEMGTRVVVALGDLVEIDALLGERRFEEALGLIQSAKRTQPLRPSLIAHEAMSFAGLGRWQEAEKRFWEARRAAVACEDEVEKAFALRHCEFVASELAWHEESVQLGQQTVDLFHHLATVEPKLFVPPLVLGINRLSNALAELGRHEEALTAVQKAASTLRQQGEPLPEAFATYLAGSLNNLGNRLSDLGRHDEALGPAQKAVAIFRRVAEQRPEELPRDLAMSLHSLGAKFGRLGRHEEALEAVQEAVSLYRELAEQRPQAFVPDLADSLSSLGATFDALGRHDDAIARRLEAGQSYVPLYTMSPERFGEALREYVLPWLLDLWQRKGGAEAQFAMADLAENLPPNDSLAADLLLTTAIWTEDWRSTSERFRAVVSSSHGVSAGTWIISSLAFAGATLSGDAPTDQLRTVRGASPDSFRSDTADALMGTVPELLREGVKHISEVERTRPRIEAVFGRDGLPGKALDLLEAGISYIKSGKKTKTLLHLPVEQRQLIQEACENPEE